MNQERLDQLITKALDEDGLIPSAVYLVGEKGSVVYKHSAGLLDFDAGTSVTTETIYDLASVTKPLVTGLLAAILIERGELSLDDRAKKFFPEFGPALKSEITIKHLASHVSGLRPWIPFYLFDRPGSPKERTLALISESEPIAGIGKEVIYSDLNFILLGFILEKITGDSLDEIAQRLVFKPLGLSNTFFNPPAELKKSIAPCETGNRYEENMCRETYPDIEPPEGVFRTEQIQGEVHDGNCYFLGGVAGHAGLFSNAEETFRIAGQFVAETSELLSPESCLMFRTNFSEGLNQSRSFSFQLAGTQGSSAGPDLPKDSFGHLGFTGTSLWINSSERRIYILLTNRTYRKDPPFGDLAELRKKFNSTAHFLLENKK